MNQTAAGLASALLTGLITVFGTALLCAWGICSGTLPTGWERPIVYACLALGSLLTSFSGARSAPARKLLFGICSTAVLFGCLLLLAVCWRGQNLQPSSVAAVSLICLLCAVPGAFPAAAFGTKRK